jgi:NADPH2:quinone reductase
MCRGSYPLTPPQPFTPGQEAAGIVTAVGAGVDTPIGSRVLCVSAFYLGHGSFAEECLALASTSFPVPQGLSDAEAAGFWIPHLTGWVGLVDRGRIQRANGSPSSAPPAAAALRRCSSVARSALA